MFNIKQNVSENLKICEMKVLKHHPEGSSKQSHSTSIIPNEYFRSYDNDYACD